MDSPALIEVSGSCVSESALNDVFEPVARTADGRWYFRGQANGRFLYFDSECSGGLHQTRSRSWIFDSIEPSTSAEHDLAQDGGECNFKAHIASTSEEPPLGMRSWMIKCGGVLTGTLLTLTDRAPTLQPTMSPVPTATTAPTFALVWEGFRLATTHEQVRDSIADPEISKIMLAGSIAVDMMFCGFDLEGDVVYAGLCVHSHKEIHGATTNATLDGKGVTRVLYVSSTGHLELRDLTVMNGFARFISGDAGGNDDYGQGGGILNYGTVTATGVKFLHNFADVRRSASLFISSHLTYSAHACLPVRARLRNL